MQLPEPLPPKQGLKHFSAKGLFARFKLPEPLPPKQGLKPDIYENYRLKHKTSRTTSTKTRIETFWKKQNGGA